MLDSVLASEDSDKRAEAIYANCGWATARYFDHDLQAKFVHATTRLADTSAHAGA